MCVCIYDSIEINERDNQQEESEYIKRKKNNVHMILSNISILQWQCQVHLRTHIFTHTQIVYPKIAIIRRVLYKKNVDK